MKSIDLMDNWMFNNQGPHAEPVHIDRNGRAVIFTLRPGQNIREHNAPSSPFYVVILSGCGVFTGEEGLEQKVGPNTLLVFDPGEQHTVRALDELVYIGFLQGAPGAKIKPPALTQTLEA